MRIDIYSDTVCPWCYLGKRRFEVAVAARPHSEPRIVWRPFELNPDMPVEGVERAAYLNARVGPRERVNEIEAELERQGASAGIAFRFDLIKRVPNSRLSHLLIAHAARRGRQALMKERVMRAYFEEGCDVGDIEELVRLAAEVGLAENECRSALVLRAGQDGVVAAERHAAVLGISGVPTYLFDGQYVLSGAQDVATLTRIFDQVEGLAAAKDIAS